MCRARAILGLDGAARAASELLALADVPSRAEHLVGVAR
jgi:hypothetical protein